MTEPLNPWRILQNINLTDSAGFEIFTAQSLIAPAEQAFAKIWGSVCVSCHSDLVEAMCPRCTGLARTHANMLNRALIDWDAVRAETTRIRAENDIRLFHQFVTEAAANIVRTDDPFGAFGEAERIDDTCTGSTADLPAFLDFGPAGPAGELTEGPMGPYDPMLTEFTCAFCGQLYTPSEDATSDEIFCCQEHRAEDQAEHDAATQHLDPL